MISFVPHQTEQNGHSQGIIHKITFYGSRDLKIDTSAKMYT